MRKDYINRQDQLLTLSLISKDVYYNAEMNQRHRVNAPIVATLTIFATLKIIFLKIIYQEETIHLNTLFNILIFNFTNKF